MDIAEVKSLTAVAASGWILSMDEKDLTPYLNGEALYGDDFTPEQLEAWYRDEQDGYYELATAETDDPEQRPGYAYHALNQWHGFRRLGKRNFGGSTQPGWGVWR